MKRIITLILVLSLSLLVLTACGQGSDVTPDPPGQDGADGGGDAADGNTDGGAVTGDGLKTGLAVISSMAKSTDAGDKDGLAQVDSTVAAVTVDAEGRITSCKIDAVQTKINFSVAGKVTTPLDTLVRSKQELKTDYGMGAVSSINKEWNEQADAFAEYVTGKTLDEVKGITVNEEGVPTVVELTSSVTMHVTDLIAVIEKAVGNAQNLGAKAGDKLGLGIVTTIDKSTDATAEKDGLAQAYSMYTATTFGADGRITSSVIDAFQSNVNFNTTGKITTDVNAANLQTKNELGDAYGMRQASGIKKEWNEQAAAFAAYVKGMTPDEVKGIAINEEGVPAEAELTSSVTVHVTDFLTIIEKASQNAK